VRAIVSDIGCFNSRSKKLFVQGFVVWAVGFSGAPSASCCLLVLVEKKQTIHVSTSTVQSASTWSHAGGVEKNIYPTPKQTQKRNAAAKLSLPLKQSCGRIKTAANTKR
jgi:hypothetical protein